MDDALYTAAADFIKTKLAATPEIGIVLGSGLGGLAEKIENPVYINYGEIPGFATSTAPGHAGRFAFGTLAGKYTLCMQGRLHYYEGYGMDAVTFPIRVMKLLGVKTLLLTNACGGVNPAFSVGDFMLITDHINFMGQNPLIGANNPNFGPRFCDMTYAYTPRLRTLALAAAEECGIEMQQGVYLGYSGPSFETPAEIRAFRGMGADAVGMSTVPEVIVASHCNLPTLAISMVTNMAAGMLPEKLDENHVIETAKARAAVLQTLVLRILEKL